MAPFDAALADLTSRIEAVAEGNPRYLEPMHRALTLAPDVAVERLRTLLIATHRDLEKQQMLFGEALPDDEAELTSSLREAASTRAATEYRLPYYACAERILKLASGNADQFMLLCGELFSEMQILMSVGRDPRLSFETQDRIMRAAARTFWESIPQVVPHGRAVQRLVSQIAAMARAEDTKPKLPYPPGVTGFSVWASHMEDLKASESRVDASLLALLADSVAYNVLSLDTERRSKGHDVYVFYLNRLLCAHFELSLGFGGHREQRMSELHRWAGFVNQESLL
jgi:hypothetical protein